MLGDRMNATLERRSARDECPELQPNSFIAQTVKDLRELSNTWKTILEGCGGVGG